jgi:hypothetical protein
MSGSAKLALAVLIFQTKSRSNFHVKVDVRM